MTRRKKPPLVNLSTDTAAPEVLTFYLGVHHTEGLIIDANHSNGQMWKGVPYKPVRNDIDPKYLPNLDLNYDWNDLPKHLAAHSFSTFVGDPLFLTDLGKESIMREAFATELNEFEGDDIVPKVAQLLDVARYLIHPKTGTAILKIGDQVHGVTRQFQPQKVWELAGQTGWYRCDVFVTDSVNMPQTGRKRIEHINSQVYWLVLHPDGALKRCPGPGRAYPGHIPCAYCGRVVHVEIERRPAYCRPPRACRQMAYYKRIGSEARQDRALARQIRTWLAEGSTITDIAAALDTSQRNARAMVAGVRRRKATTR